LTPRSQDWKFEPVVKRRSRPTQPEQHGAADRGQHRGQFSAAIAAIREMGALSGRRIELRLAPARVIRIIDNKL
jgi:hypothetical protein